MERQMWELMTLPLTLKPIHARSQNPLKQFDLFVTTLYAVAFILNIAILTAEFVIVIMVLIIFK